MNKHNWQGVIGQSDTLTLLESFLDSNIIPQALLFSGPKGVGKELIAARFAGLLHNKFSTKSSQPEKFHDNLFTNPFVNFIIPIPRGKNEGNNDNPIEKLSKEDYTDFINDISEKNRNPYLILTREEKNDIRINSIREVVKNLSVTYGEDFHRTVIISPAEAMNEEAQNALLKTLEEPPPGTTFILVSNNPSYLRETIRSRCWQVPFQPLNQTHLSEVLTTYYGIQPQLADQLSKISDGNLPLALQLLEEDINDIMSKVINILRHVIASKLFIAYNLFSEATSGDEYKGLIIIKLILLWLRDLEFYKTGNMKLYFDAYQETFAKLLQRYPTIECMPTISIIEKNLYYFQNNNLNFNIIIFNIFMSLSELTESKLKAE